MAAVAADGRLTIASRHHFLRHNGRGLVPGMGFGNQVRQIFSGDHNPTDSAHLLPFFEHHKNKGR